MCHPHGVRDTLGTEKYFSNRAGTRHSLQLLDCIDSASRSSFRALQGMTEILTYFASELHTALVSPFPPSLTICSLVVSVLFNSASAPQCLHIHLLTNIPKKASPLGTQYVLLCTSFSVEDHTTDHLFLKLSRSWRLYTGSMSLRITAVVLPEPPHSERNWN